MLGKKTGGRKKGTPNKNKAEVAARLEALGCDPIEGMAMIAMDEKNTPDLRGRMYAELAQYLAPKLRSIDHSGEVNHNHVARVPEAQPDIDTWQHKHANGATTIQ